MKRFLPSVAAIALTAACAIPASAQLASPVVRDGDFHCFRGVPEAQITRLPALRSHASNSLRAKKLGDSKYDNTDGHDLREIKTEGEPNILVILVEFQDTRFLRQWGDPNTLVNDMLNSDDFTFQNATGSVRDYYKRVSGGQFAPKFEIHGPVTVSRKAADYAHSAVIPGDTYIDPATGKEVNCYAASRMVQEAVSGLDPEVDFSKFDLDGDGYADFVYLFFAGQGATTGGGQFTTPWPHAFTLTAGIGAPVELDGVLVDRYCMSSELGKDFKLSGIGTFCHEFGHVLGLPDLYDTANNNGQQSKCFTPGPFSNMDAGNYNNNEHTPPTFSSYEQYSLEWMKPAQLSGTGLYTMLPLEARPFAYQVSSPVNPKEYYLLEARGKSYLDQWLPNQGLLVWHIDFDLDTWLSNKPNNLESHLRIDLIESDNNKSATTREGDPFPGTAGICEFTKNITPAFKDWNGNSLGYDLTQIAAEFDGTVSFYAKGSSQIDPKAELAAPAPAVKSIGADEISIEWPAVENASVYYVSVFDYAAMTGVQIPFSAYAPGYYFRNVGDANSKNGICSAILSGLPSNRRLAIMVYAANDLNASRMTEPILANTVDGTDFENASTNLIIGSSDEGAIIEWDPVEGADSYELKVVTRTPGEATSTVNADFEGSRLPDNWNSSYGKYDTRKFGAASPSYALTAPGASLASNVYADEISAVSFWACKRYNDEGCELSVYALDKDGNASRAHLISDLTREGGNFSLPMPAGTHGVKFVYYYRTTDTYVYVDDICLTFHGGYTDTDAAEAIIEKYTDTAYTVKGLKEATDYIAYVTPVKADASKGARSNEVAFRVENLPVSGVEDVALENSFAFSVSGMTIVPADASASYDVFSADGMHIASAHKGALALPARGIYLLRSADGKTAKIRL